MQARFDSNVFKALEMSDLHCRKCLKIAGLGTQHPDEVDIPTLQREIVVVRPPPNWTQPLLVEAYCRKCFRGSTHTSKMWSGVEKLEAPDHVYHPDQFFANRVLDVARAYHNAREMLGLAVARTFPEESKVLLLEDVPPSPSQQFLIVSSHHRRRLQPPVPHLHPQPPPLLNHMDPVPL